MGLDIGMKNGGIKSFLACEFNKYCRMTISQNEPDMELIGDINKYEPEEILKLAKVPEGRKIDVIFWGLRAKLLVLQEQEERWMMKEVMFF